MLFFGGKEKKSDEELNVRYHPGDMKYLPCDENGNYISIEQLTGAQAALLAEKNKALANPILLRQAMLESSRADRARQLAAMGFDTCCWEVLGTTRSTESISPEIRKWLDEIVAEENVLIGVHRTGEAKLEHIADILCGGLIINPKDKGGAFSSIALGNNVSYYSNNETVVKELLCADEWRDSLGSILIRIPDEQLLGNIFMIDSEDGTFYLDPKYIIGFVPLGSNGKITEVISSNYYDGGGKPFIKPLTAIYDDREYASIAQGTAKGSGGEGTKK